MLLGAYGAVPDASAASAPPMKTAPRQAPPFIPEGALWDQTIAIGLDVSAPAEPASAPKERTVAMFYFLWACESGETREHGPTDVSRILGRYPEAARQPFHPAWGASHYDATGGSRHGANHHYLYWGEPLFGYYCADDRWVLRRHMQLLANVGVDVIVLDATNAVTYDRVVARLLEALRGLAMQGRAVPRIAFYTNSQSGTTMRHLYDTFYRLGAKARDPARWFSLEGKPLIIGRAAEADPEVAAFFTIRESQWPNEPVHDCGWPWIEFVRPQPVHRCRSRNEIMNVSVAQHAETLKMSSWSFDQIDLNWGRGYHNGVRDHGRGAIFSGLNFQEEWERVFATDPPIVFVTGWNEWIAARFAGAGQHFMVDLATPEFSRDIEIVRGEWGDAYYRQLFQNVRRYKGATAAVPLRCGGAGLTFRDYAGDTAPRDAMGAGSIRLVNRSGRNDIVAATLMCNADTVWFEAMTAAPLSKPGGAGWMELMFGLTDALGRPGARRFAINRLAPEGRCAKLEERMANGWRTLDRCVSYSILSRSLSLRVHRKALGPTANLAGLWFKWADNGATDIGDLRAYDLGDSAPDGGLAYWAPLVGTEGEVWRGTAHEGVAIKKWRSTR